MTFTLICYLFFNLIDFTIAEPVYFQTEDGSFKFICISSKGRDVDAMLKEYERYLDNTGQKARDKNMTIYRTTPINYFRINKWIKYRLNPEWQYPYLYNH